jgi:hypothetical protein
MLQKVKDALKSSGDDHIKVVQIHKPLQTVELQCDKHGIFYLTFVFFFGKNISGKGPVIVARRCPFCKAEGAVIPNENLEFDEVVKRANELGFSPVDRDNGLPFWDGSRRWRCLGQQGHIIECGLGFLPKSGCLKCNALAKREKELDAAYTSAKWHLKAIGGKLLTPRNVYSSKSDVLSYTKTNGEKGSLSYLEILKLLGPDEKFDRLALDNFDALKREAIAFGYKLLTPKSRYRSLTTRISVQHIESGVKTSVMAASLRRSLIGKKRLALRARATKKGSV